MGPTCRLVETAQEARDEWRTSYCVRNGRKDALNKAGGQGVKGRLRQ